MEEIWKPINGYEGFYEISSLGRIRSLSRTVKSKGDGTAVTKECVLNPWLCKSTGYYMVTLYKYGKRQRQSVHRLLAEAFISNPDNKPCIDHINGIRSDNRIENLRWCTYKENTTFPIAVENRILCMSHLSKKVVQIDINTGEVIQVYRSAGEVQRQHGFRRANITSCCNNRKPTAYGYKWRHVE